MVVGDSMQFHPNLSPIIVTSDSLQLHSNLPPIMVTCDSLQLPPNLSPIMVTCDSLQLHSNLPPIMVTCDSLQLHPNLPPIMVTGDCQQFHPNLPPNHDNWWFPAASLQSTSQSWSLVFPVVSPHSTTHHGNIDGRQISLLMPPTLFYHRQRAAVLPICVFDILYSSLAYMFTISILYLVYKELKWQWWQELYQQMSRSLTW